MQLRKRDSNGKMIVEEKKPQKVEQRPRMSFLSV